MGKISQDGCSSIPASKCRHSPGARELLRRCWRRRALLLISLGRLHTTTPAEQRQPVWRQLSEHLSKLNEYRLHRVRGSLRPIRSHFAKYKASQSGISLPFSHSLPSQIVAMGTATERQLINTIISLRFLPFSPILFTPTKAFLF